MNGAFKVNCSHRKRLQSFVLSLTGYRKLIICDYVSLSTSIELCSPAKPRRSNKLILIYHAANKVISNRPIIKLIELDQ